jgi:hypothetical protein
MPRSDAQCPKQGPTPPPLRTTSRRPARPSVACVTAKAWLRLPLAHLGARASEHLASLISPGEIRKAGPTASPALQQRRLGVARPSHASRPVTVGGALQRASQRQLANVGSERAPRRLDTPPLSHRWLSLRTKTRSPAQLRADAYFPLQAVAPSRVPATPLAPSGRARWRGLRNYSWAVWDLLAQDGRPFSSSSRPSSGCQP